jgi:predicted RNase H-like HicB family nuclease
MIKDHFKIHREKKGFWAECLELDGCITQADNREEVYKKCEEVLNLFLEEPANSKIVFPLAVLLRNYRINSNMTQKQVAEMRGMKNIYSYQRLEKKSNPTLAIINKTHTIFPDINLNYLLQ